MAINSVTPICAVFLDADKDKGIVWMYCGFSSDNF